MKKVMVIGCPGSGKSTLSIALSKATGLPLTHLDMLNWNADGTTVEKSIFLQQLTQAIDTPAWIIDGNYSNTLEMRLNACDTVIFLDYPTDVCISGILERRGKPRQDIPWVEKADEIDPEFLEFVENYNQTNRPQVLALLQAHPDKNILILKSREEAEMLLHRLS